MDRQLAPVFLLALLSPVVAEFLLGDQYLIGPPSLPQLAELDQGYVAALGVSPPWTVYVLGLHAVWSISSPIAVVEGRWGERPWLGRVGLAVVAVLAGLGAAATFAVSWLTGDHYLAPLPQLLAAAAVAGALVVVAFRLPRVPARARRPHPAGFVVGLLVSSAFLLVRTTTGTLSPVLTTGLLLGIAAVGVVVVARARRADPFGLGAGAVAAYCWHGMPAAVEAGPAAVVEQVVLVVLVLGLLGVLARRALDRAGEPAAV